MMASWLRLKNLNQGVLPSARAMSAVCPSTLTEVISSSGECHSDRRGKLEMSSTPSSPIEIRAKGQLVPTTPNAVGTQRRTPVNECWATTLIDANGREEIEHCPRTLAEAVTSAETTGHRIDRSR